MGLKDDGGIEMTKKFRVYPNLTEIEAENEQEAWEIFEEWYSDIMSSSETTSCQDIFDIEEESK